MKALVCDACKKVMTTEKEKKETLNIMIGDEYNCLGTFHLCKKCENDFYRLVSGGNVEDRGNLK